MIWYFELTLSMFWLVQGGSCVLPRQFNHTNKVSNQRFSPFSPHKLMLTYFYWHVVLLGGCFMHYRNINKLIIHFYTKWWNKLWCSTENLTFRFCLMSRLKKAIISYMLCSHFLSLCSYFVGRLWLRVRALIHLPEGRWFALHVIVGETLNPKFHASWRM